MLLRLLLLFTLVPLLELYLLIWVGSRIGALSTVLLVLLTALAGAHLARLQGLQTLWKIRQNLAFGIMPAEELLDAFLIFVAGMLLITPGFLTDAVGFLLLFPGTRGRFKDWIRHRLSDWIRRDSVNLRFFT